MCGIQREADFDGYRFGYHWGGTKYLIFTFPRSGNKAKRELELCHSTHNAKNEFSRKESKGVF